MGNYRKKPVVIEAVQFTGKNFFEISEFTNGNAHDCYMQPEGYTTCIINTLEGMHIATEGDFIIKGVHGEFYPCKPDIFEKTYEAADLPKTNADRIRAMSDEELAEWLARTQYVNMMEAAEIFGTQLPFEEETLKGSEQECLHWLKQPAKGE